MQAVQCDGCGGSIAVVIGKPDPTCLFCGSTALVPVDPDREIEHPTEAAPFDVPKSKADGAFRAFARSSFFYPPAIRDASLQLRPLLVPAWKWSGSLETYFTGLKRAATKSGKAPVSGTRHLNFQQVVVPASATLTQAEMNGLGVWDEAKLQHFEEAASQVPWELAELSREAAREAALSEMERLARDTIANEASLIKTLTSGIPHDLDGRPVLLPVWIGAYRHKDVAYRVLVNGQTGELHGEAPYDWLRILMVVALTLGALFLAFVVCSGVLAVLG